MFGRVIRDDCALEPPYAPRPWKRTKGIYLVYFYKGVSQTTDRVPSLAVENLLFAPCKTSQYGWNKGLFRPVAVLPIRAGEVFSKHCFTFPKRLFIVDNNRYPTYFTEYGDPLDGPLEYCVESSLYGCYEIEGQIARALGLSIRDTKDEWIETGSWSDVGSRAGNSKSLVKSDKDHLSTKPKTNTAIVTENDHTKLATRKQRSPRKPGKK